VRDEGTTIEYIPQGFPAVADFDIVNKLILSVEKENVKYFVGINRTHDAFYGGQKSIAKWGEYLLSERWRNSDTPILSSEMESSALFIVASMRNVKAGAIFAVNASPEPLNERVFGKKIETKTENSKDTTGEIVKKMIKIALEAIIVL
jgi:uridine phosphorylase